ncbi:MAG: flagellar biosynthesis repressor FlbT [Beijerinckiaceae bacterium]|nr:flagellar biosynthesis repressor FlbT [Beijerinckiaceae bacterium]
MHISLRSGEKLYINGAVLRADRKVSLELLNDAIFLLEAHVMKIEDAATPLRQLYFIIQIMLMNPNECADALHLCQNAIRLTMSASDNAALNAGLHAVKALVDNKRYFEALRAVRALFPVEAQIMAAGESTSPTQAA